MVFLSFNSNTTGATVTSGAGTNNPCGATFLRADYCFSALAL